jgi:hypothetical protein
METDSKEAAMEDVGEISLTASAATLSEAERLEIPAASTQTGQLQQQQRGFGHHRTPLALTWLDAL